MTRRAPRQAALGLVLRDVEVRGDEIASVGESLPGPGADCGGSILFACFVDAHTHMVKNHAAPRARNPTGAINDALATEIEDQPPAARRLLGARRGTAVSFART